MQNSVQFLSFTQNVLMYKEFTESLKGFLAELEETRVGDRRLASITFDVRAGKVDLSFEDAEPNVHGSLLAAYEIETEGMKREWQANFERWQKRHYGAITRVDYQERTDIELRELLNSAFLMPEDDMLNKEKLAKATAELEKKNLPVVHAAKYALMCDLLKKENGIFSFDDTEALERYLEVKEEDFSRKSIVALMRFKYAMEMISPLLSAMIIRGSRTRVRALAESSVRTREVFKLKNSTLPHMELLWVMLTGLGWVKSEDKKAWLDLFGGEPCDCVVTWTGKVGVGTLKELFAQMIAKNIIQEESNYVSIIESHFKDVSGNYLTNVKGGKPNDKTSAEIERMMPKLKSTYDITEGIDEEFSDIRYGQKQYWDDHKERFPST